MLVNNSMFNFYRENSFAIEFRVRGWVVGGDDEGGGDDDNDVVLAPDPWTVRKTDVKEEEGTLRTIVAIRKTRRTRAVGTCTLFFFCRIFFTILSLNIGQTLLI